jgi:hypothetical protein
MRKFRLRRLGVADDPGFHQPHLQDCLEAVLEQSPLLMEDVLAGLQAAALPGSGQRSLVITDALARQTLESLAEHAPALKQGFASHLRTYVYGGQSGRQIARQSMRFEDFQFLDSDQIDASIEFAQSQQAVQMAVEDVLPTLNAMVSNLLGWSSVLGHLNPLKPASFVHALRETLEEFVPERAERASIMGPAASLLGASLHKLYREVTEWLRSQGVEPVHMSPTTSTGLWNPTNAAESTVARTMLTLDKLRRLLTGELDANPGTAGAVDFSHTIPASMEALQDMKLVEPMMKRLSDRAAAMAQPKAADAEAPVVDMLAQADDQVKRVKLGVQLGQEVVLLMVEHLLQDARLLPQVRDCIKKLEPVLVKLSQQDGRLFSERQHPARLFLDRMTHRSLAFPTSDAQGYAAFQASFDQAVSQLCSGAGDAAAFAQVVRALDESWASDEAEQHRRASTAARGLLHAEQRNLLAHRLGQQFAERLQGKKVPELVVAFLTGPWAHVVAQAQLSMADGSVDPGGYQGLVDDLIWSVQLRLTRRNRGRLVQMVPDMLVTMRRGLELISYPPERMTQFFEALISIHEQVFDSARSSAGEPAARAVVPATTPPAPEVAAVEAGAADPLTADGFWVAQKEASDSGFLKDAELAQTPAAPKSADQAMWSVDGLTTGSWVDLALAGNWVRAQLTWASPQRTLFMFISGTGMAHSMSRRTVDRLKKSKLIRLVSDGRVMDNALDAVAQSALRNDLLSAKPKLPE